MLEVCGLSKNYGSKKAVNNISFTVGAGEILGFLGPNGAGKSTTMNMITGYLASSSGNVLIEGVNVLEQPQLAKRKIGYLPEKPPLYMDMSVEEYLNFVYSLKQVRIPRKAHLAEVCELAGVEHVRRRMIRNLSKGYQQRVGIAQALLGYPPLLILDEPTVGLDPKQIVEIRDLIAQLGKKQTILLSSHILPEVQAVCSRILVINNGVLVADGTPETLAQSLHGSQRLTVRVAASRTEAQKALMSVPGIQSLNRGTEAEPGIYEFTLEQAPGQDVRRALFEVLAQRKMPIMALERERTSLEDLFLALTATGKEE